MTYTIELKFKKKIYWGGEYIPRTDFFLLLVYNSFRYTEKLRQ